MTSWPQNAYVGQKVVCIDDTPGKRLPGWQYVATPLIKNEIYKIQSIDLIPCMVHGLSVFFKLEDLDGHWLTTRFRPVQSTDTGMVILKELLINPHKALEDA